MQAGLQQDWGEWEEQFAQFLENETGQDPAHDRGHVLRVVANAKVLAAKDGARLDIVIPAAWLHDCVIVPKNSEQRQRASVMAARRAAAFLKESGYPAENIAAIEHAIAAHSFSAGIEAETLEAKVVQDADRLDAIGAIGIARCFAVGGALGTPFYDLGEPFPVTRQANDREFVVDHFYVKLFKLVDQMGTPAGRQEAERRTAVMRQFLAQLGDEISFGSETQ
ncbi:MAG: HD domain-containing protein [Candidatus Promineifilaceae bacterium]|jgi:uncharacterized protein